MRSSKHISITSSTKPGREKKPPKQSRLRELSTKSLWRLLKTVQYELGNDLFYSESYIKGLQKRELDLAEALAERLEYDDARNPFELDLDIEAFRKGEEEPARKALCKAPNRGYKREPKPTPNGKNTGLYKVIRPKPRG